MALIDSLLKNMNEVLGPIPVAQEVDEGVHYPTMGKTRTGKSMWAGGIHVGGAHTKYTRQDHLDAAEAHTQFANRLRAVNPTAVHLINHHVAHAAWHVEMSKHVSDRGAGRGFGAAGIYATIASQHGASLSNPYPQKGHYDFAPVKLPHMARNKHESLSDQMHEAVHMAQGSVSACGKRNVDMTSSPSKVTCNTCRRNMAGKHEAVDETRYKVNLNHPSFGDPIGGPHLKNIVRRMMKNGGGSVQVFRSEGDYRHVAGWSGDAILGTARVHKDALTPVK